jgi:ABC-type branched-subunit amino acid transport system permease subunit
MAFSVSTLSPTSFVVIGSLVAVAMTYLAGVSSIGGALVAGVLAQSGILVTTINETSGSDSSKSVFAISGLALIIAAIWAPEGITGLVRARLNRSTPAPAAAPNLATVTIGAGGEA